jgi:hypothetical protein
MDAEVRGDYSNLKGSVYHLRYALRMLLTGGTEGVWFYEGNDLLARPTPPPAVDETGPFPTINLGGRRDERDIWVQLKFTDTHWTPTQLLTGNLLVNFICNAVRSRRNRRRWETHLVTPAHVDQRKILPRFIANTDANDDLRLKLEVAVRAARERLIAQGIPADELADDDLRGVALEILGQLADTVPVRHETIVAEIEREIAYDYPDPLTVAQIADTLLGAMLRQAGGGPDKAVLYDAVWLAEASGRPIGTRTRLGSDPIGVCEDSITRSLPRGWRADRCVRRPRLEEVLVRFLDAPETAFVLLGETGSGKSWAVADWAVRALNGQPRLLLSGSDLPRRATLDGLVAGELREFGPPDWTDPFFVRRLAAAANGGRGPLVFVVDDVEVGPNGSGEMRRTLASLVRDCSALGAKLVLTSQESTWDLYRLHQDLDPLDVFRPSHDTSRAASTPAIPGAEVRDGREEPAVEPSEALSYGTSPEPPAVASAGSERRAALHSYILDAYSDDELADALVNRLGIDRRNDLIQNVATPHYVPLRNPYLLDLFLDQHRGAAAEAIAHGTPVVVDALLDRRVEEGLDRASATVDVHAEEMRAAFDGLIDELWEHRRRGGMLTGEIVRFFEEHLQAGVGRAALSAMQIEDLLSTQSPVRIAQPAVADRLFAKRLADELATEEMALDELSPESDSGVVVALLRAHADPVPLAETLLARDRGWRRAVCAGLAQGNPDDPRILALLTILARADETGLLGVEAAEALGYLAARSRRAWKWVARLYLGDRASNQLFAERALGVTANLVPAQVAAAVRLRLERAARLNRNRVTERRRRDRLLTGAVTPFVGVRNRIGAETALRLIERYADLAGPGESGLNHRFAGDVDAVRGVASLALGGDALSAVFEQLRSATVADRFRAARAFKPVALERPEAVAEALCTAIRSEEHPDVLKQLLWTAHRVATVTPRALFEAVAASRAANWQEAPRTAGTAFALLSDLTDDLPEHVFELLPRHLGGYEPNVRALHAEALAFVWWRVAERVQEARPVLAELARPNVDDVSDEFRVFAFRGAAVARLGMLSLDLTSSAELVGWHNAYSGLGLQFLFLWTDEFVRRHAARLVNSPDLELLRQTLKDAVEAEDRHEFEVLQRDLRNAAFHCANLCLEMLAALAAASPDPLVGLENLPRSRQALYVARRLLELGRATPEVIAFARAACDEHAVDGLTTGTAERERCLSLLAALQPDGEAALSEHRAGRRLTLGADDGQAGVIAQLGAREPDRFLSLLDESISDQDDLPTLYHLREFTLTWPQQLVAEVYARMFSTAPVKPAEAEELTATMLQAVTALPESPERREYEAVYGAINRYQSGQPFDMPSLPEATSAIQRSHRWAMALLARRGDMAAAGQDLGWLDGAICDREGWWEATHFRLAGDTTHFFKDTAYVFPAVRLALAAIGGHHGIVDPGGQWADERMATSDFLDRWSRVLNQDMDLPEDRAACYRAFQEREGPRPRDERFWANYGLMALLVNELEEAERILEHTLELPWATDSTKARSLYNLACVHALRGRESACRAALEQCLALERTPVTRFTLETDEDFNQMRDKPWFDELLSTLREHDLVQDTGSLTELPGAPSG